MPEDKSKNIPSHFHVTRDIARTVLLPKHGTVLMRGSEIELNQQFIEDNTDRNGVCDVLNRVLDPHNTDYMPGRCPDSITPTIPFSSDLARVIPKPGDKGGKLVTHSVTVDLPMPPSALSY